MNTADCRDLTFLLRTQSNKLADGSPMNNTWNEYFSESCCCHVPEPMGSFLELNCWCCVSGEEHCGSELKDRLFRKTLSHTNWPIRSVVTRKLQLKASDLSLQGCVCVWSLSGVDGGMWPNTRHSQSEIIMGHNCRPAEVPSVLLPVSTCSCFYMKATPCSK